MTYENRLVSNYAFGTLSQAAAISDTTLNSVDFSTALPSGLSTATYAPIALLDQSAKTYEIAWATAHTSAATSATVIRGREGSTARAWPSGTLWATAPTTRDVLLPVASRAALPTDPHIGLRALLQDEQLVLTYTAGVGWAGDVGSDCHAEYKLTTTQTIPTTTPRKLYFNTAVATSPLVSVTLGTLSTGSYFTLNRAGLWCVSGGCEAAWTAGLNFRALNIADDVASSSSWRGTTTYCNNGGVWLSVSGIHRYAAGAKVALWFYQEQGSNMDVSASGSTSIDLTWMGL